MSFCAQFSPEIHHFASLIVVRHLAPVRASDLGSWASDLGSRVSDLVAQISGLEPRDQGLRASDLGARASDLGIRVSWLRSLVSSLETRASGPQTSGLRAAKRLGPQILGWSLRRSGFVPQNSGRPQISDRWLQNSALEPHTSGHGPQISGLRSRVSVSQISGLSRTQDSARVSDPGSFLRRR